MWISWEDPWDPPLDLVAASLPLKSPIVGWKTSSKTAVIPSKTGEFFFRISHTELWLSDVPKTKLQLSLGLVGKLGENCRKLWNMKHIGSLEKIWATLETIGKLWKEIWKNIGKKIGKHIGELFETTNPPSPAAIGACARRFKVGLGHPTSSDSHLQIPSGNLLHSYWKWPFIVDFPIKNGGCP